MASGRNPRLRRGTTRVRVRLLWPALAAAAVLGFLLTLAGGSGHGLAAGPAGPAGTVAAGPAGTDAAEPGVVPFASVALTFPAQSGPRDAFEREVGSVASGSASAAQPGSSAGPRVQAVYHATSVHLLGPGWSGSVGLGEFGRAGRLVPVSGILDRRPDGARYRGSGLEESFANVPAGIEQSFIVSNRAAGPGPLAIEVGLTELRASGSGTDRMLVLRSAAGRAVGVYSGLRVTDADGRVIPASMRASAGGRSIVIDVADERARYPLRIDPIIGPIAEADDPGASAGDSFGDAVAVSGSTAVVGAPGSDTAYVYDIGADGWTLTQAISDPAGAAGDRFGAAVAISGATIVIGDSSQTVSGNSEQGAAYVYGLSDGTWVNTATLTASDGAAVNFFGSSVATSGSTIAVGAPNQGSVLQGAIYVYTSSGASWPQTAELTPSDSDDSDQLGSSVSISQSGATIAGGAISYNSNTGTAYVYTLSGSSWTQAPRIVLPVSDATFLPATVAASDSTVVVGDQYSGGDAGAAYIYTPSGGGAWTLATTLTAADGGGFFGRALAISGSTLVVGAFGRDLGNGSDQGAAYVYAGAGASWTQQGADLSAADGASGDYFGFSVAISGNEIVSGAYGHAGGGAAYLFGPQVQQAPMFTVTTAQDTNDGACYVGDCSLRDAITAADAQPSGSALDDIQFDIPGSYVQTIQPETPLPAITHPVEIDGTTEPGYAGSPVIQLDGGECGVSPCDGLDIDAGKSTLRGLDFTGFSGNGILLTGGGDNVVESDWIGWNPPGGGFDGNQLDGIAIAGSSGNQIGGTAAQDRVVAGGNGDAGLNGADILISGSASSGNTVQNSWIGLGSNGTSPGNDRNGILLNAGATDNTIGGSEATGNVIYGAYAEGVYVTLAGTGNVIAGNTIGANASGSVGGYTSATIGITVQDSPGTVIGDDAAPGTLANTANGNVIVGQTGYAGIFINSADTTVAGNFIGTDRSGDPGLGNGYGVYVDSGEGNVIGPGNTVADNTGIGVDINSSGTQVTANSIHDNGGASELTAALPPYSDVAAPQLMASAPQSGTATVINGTATGTAGSSVAVELFDSPSCGAGQGTTYLGSDTVTIGAGGSAPVSVASVAPVLGHVITATATTTLAGDTSPSTSVFSNCASVVNGGPDNDAWTRAQTISLNGSGAGSASGAVDLSGQSRWYKIPVTPGGTVQVNLSNVPADYDLALFSDISQAEQSLSSTGEPADGRGRDARQRVQPVGVLAVGVQPVGVLAVGVQPVGVLAVGVQPVGVLAVGVQPVGVLAVGVQPVGVLAVGVQPVGVLAVGVQPRRCSRRRCSAPRWRSRIPRTMRTRRCRACWRSPTTPAPPISRSTPTSGTTPATSTSASTASTAPTTRARTSRVNVQENAGTCGGVAPSTAPLLSSSFTVPGPSYKTLILTDESRMTDDGDLSTMESDLATFAGLSSVDGTIVDVGAISPRVTALQAQADSNSACPYAENLVADAIRNVLSAVRAANSGLEYIVIVGDDHVIPFFRYPDNAGIGPESGYVPPVLDPTPSYASLESNDFLSQDAYGATTVLSIQGVDVPVPDLPVGRLVETPTEIDGMLQAYMSLTGGVVATPTSSLVTGYDFMTRGADAVESDLQAGLGAGATNDTLITNDGVAPSDTGNPPTQSWTASQLETALLAKRHDLIFLAGHFSANNTLAADYSTTMNAEQLANSSVNLENSIVFSAGCHSGYNIVSNDAVPGVTQALDWVGAFAQHQATLIAGTGYQYGDTDFLAYSEQLYADFSHALRFGSGAVAVGSALVDAKSTYLDHTANLQGIDIKSLLEATLYGLPMLSVNLPAGRIPQPTSSSIVSSTTPETSNPGATLGLSSTDVTLSPTLTTETTQLESASGGAAPVATYLSGPSGASTSPGAPTLPLAVNDVSVPGQVLRGVGFIGGTYSDQSGITPLTGAPATELNGVHSTFASSAFFPSRLWTVNYFGGLNGGPAGTQLMLTPAQYESDAPGSLTDDQRSYSSVGLRLFYSANTASYGSNTPALAAPPTIQQVNATVNGGTVSFQVHVVGDPSAGIQQVWVTYSGVDTPSNGTGEWESLNLTQNATDSTLWTGTLSGLSASQIAALRFVVQAVNGVGLVGLDDNNGSYYQPGQISGGLETGQTQTPTTMALNSPPSSGGFGGSVPVSATLTEGGSPVAGAAVTFTIGGSSVEAVTGSNGVAHGQLQLEDLPGTNYQLTAAFNGNSTLAGTSASTPSFTVAKLATTLTLSGSSSANVGASSGISASLQSGGTGVSGYSVAFVLTPTGAGTPVVETAITALGGVAQLGAVPQLSPGMYSVQAFFGPGAPIALPSDPIFMASHTTTPFTLTVTGQAPAIQSASATTFTVGSAGSFAVMTTGVPTNTITNANFSGCTKSPALPSGVTLTDNGNDTATLAGTPAAGTAGSYTLCLNASNGIGSAATQTFTLTIALATPTTPAISNLPASGTYGGGFTATVATNGDGTRSVSSSTTSVCTVASGTQISYVGVGTCTLTAQVSAGATYAAAHGAAQSFSVGAAPLTITASSPSMTYGATVPVITAGYQVLVGGDTPASLKTAPSCKTSATSTSAPGTYPTSCSGAVDANYKITYVAGTITVTQAATTVTYTGLQTASTKSTFVPAATLSSAASACQSGQSVAFTLNVNPSTGAAGPYTLESATTTAAGVATGASISTASWVYGSYTITATYAGNTDCAGSTVNMALSVTEPGLATTGFGLYTVPGAGNVTFAFGALLVSPAKGTYVGAISLVNDRRWQLIGSVSAYSKSSSTSATISGTGNLYWWNTTLNHSIGGWALAASNVAYTATYTETTKTSAGTFGVTITYTPAAGQPTPLPNSAPIKLTAGTIALS